MAGSSYSQQHGRQWAFLAPQPSEYLIRVQLCLVCLEQLFVGPVLARAAACVPYVCFYSEVLVQENMLRASLV